MASRRFVFPWAFGPTATVRPGPTSTAVSAWFRKSRISIQTSRTVPGYVGPSADVRGEAHGHDEVDEPVPFALDQGRLQAVSDFDHDPLPHNAGQPVGQILWIERRGELLPFVLRLDDLDRPPEVGR